MRIGVDIDGVVADFVTTFLLLVKKRYGLMLRQQDIYVHDLYLVLGIPRDEAMDLIRETIRCDLQPYPGAIRGLARLRRNHGVMLVTSRPRDMMDVTKRWLSRRNIPHDRLLQFQEGSKHRSEYPFDVFVDDHLREALALVGKVPHIILFDRPWNRSFNVAGHLKRAHSWGEIVSIVETCEQAS